MTVRGVEAEIAPKVAVIVDEPSATPVTTPFVPCTLLMEAVAGVAELQVTEAVMSWVVLSENVPVAVNWSVDPSPTVGLSGVMAMDESDFTVITVDPETPRVALIVVEPAARALATPRVPDVLLIVATALFDEPQRTSVVTS
jgi:hypothetical protein